jgi:hypothetical protein
MNSIRVGIAGFAIASAFFFGIADFNGDRLIKYIAGGVVLVCAALDILLYLSEKKKG